MSIAQPRPKHPMPVIKLTTSIAAPPERVFDLAWQPAEDQVTLGHRLVKEYGIMEPRELTSCYVCHR